MPEELKDPLDEEMFNTESATELDTPDWGEYDNHEFQSMEIFTGDDYPPQAADWCMANNHMIAEIEPDEEGKPRYQLQPIPEPTEEEIAARNAMLNLTAADVERGIYKAKGMDFDDVIALVEQYNEVAPLDAEGSSTGVDIKALKIELKANNFYYGSPFVKQIGAILGFTDEQILEFFKTGDYTTLM